MNHPEDHRTRVAAERRERMREHLLHSALALMARMGPEAVQIDDIVRAAEVARGTFYKYYASPAALVRDLALRLSEEVILSVNAVTRQHGDPALRAALGMRAVLGLVAACPMLGGFITRAGWPVSDPSHAFFRIVGPNLAEGMALGRFAQRPQVLAEVLMSGLAVGAMHAIVTGQTGDGFDREVAEMLLLGLGLKEAEARALAGTDLVLPRPENGTFLARAMGQV